VSDQIRPSVTNPTLASLYKDMSEGSLVLAPEFQRKFVWTQEHQEHFIDTVLRGLPFPEIYVSTGETDIDLMKTTRHVIDGQQRLTTLKNYIDGKFPRPLQIVPAYAGLNRAEKSSFLSYEVVVRDLGRIAEPVVREIFRRINLTKFKLDTVEIHNAVYDGSFISTAKEIIDEVDISVFGVFRESEFTRMSDLYFVLTVMATIEQKGYFLQDSLVEKYIERFNENYPDREKIKFELKETFKYIEKLKLPEDSMWFRKANFFTMVVETCLNLQNMRPDARAKLIELEDFVLSNKTKPDNKFGKYYSYMYQNTNGRGARVVRGEMYRDFCVIA